jgi:hypothetical protein
MVRVRACSDDSLGHPETILAVRLQVNPYATLRYVVKLPGEER